MKKLLFTLLCIICFICNVSAKTQIEYNWGIYEEEEIFDANIYKGDLALFKRNELDEFIFNVFNDKGEYKVDKPVPGIATYDLVCETGSVYFVFNDFLTSFTANCNEYYHGTLDDELNIVDAVDITESFNYYLLDYIGETDKYYYFGNNFFDKKTKQLVTIDSILETSSLYSNYNSKCETPNDSTECKNLAAQLYEDAFKGTYVPVIINYELGNIDVVNRELLSVFVNSDKGYAASFYDEDKEMFVVEFYDTDVNITKTMEFDPYIEPYVLFKDNYFYVFEVKPRESMERDISYEYYYSVTEYDYKFNKHEEFDLSSLKKEDAIELEAFPGREFWKLLSTEDGFVLITRGRERDEVPMTEIASYDYSIQEYSFIYDVEVKDNENGSITVDKDSSKNGEKVTYIVEPKKGYKLEKVIVTDLAGNKIEIRGNSFTMPSTDVIVEAIFVVDNPNTNVFVGIAVTLFFLGACLVYVILRNVRVKQFQ